MSSAELGDNIIQHMVLVHRFANWQATKLNKILSKDDIVTFQDLQKLDKNYSKARLNTLLRKVVKLNKKAYQDLLKASEIELKAFSNNEKNYYLEIYDRHNDTDIDVEPVSGSVEVSEMLIGNGTEIGRSGIVSEGETLEDWLAGIEQRDSLDKVKKIRYGVQTNQTPEEILSSVNDNRRTSMLVENLLYTSFITSTNESMLLVNNGNRGLLPFGRYTAILDNKTTFICSSLDGQIFPWNEGPRPPQHFNCRSAFLPIYTGENLNSFPSDYESWIENQDEEFLLELMGEKNYKKYLDNELELDQYVDMRARKISSLYEF